MVDLLQALEDRSNVDTGASHSKMLVGDVSENHFFMSNLEH